ncbi:hypothetical protein M514_05334 [Trichuris suis]|uniref:Uncharacterized protein n=1 Tax=Trichuris suis TaxID=68888 RepID=A0A085NQ75_9BILA|nr:hypothetical protein M513_05334 [Trichuris suis]KFD71621.1 hypothetical protein M514_05334 [Trichuris suis]
MKQKKMSVANKEEQKADYEVEVVAPNAATGVRILRKGLTYAQSSTYFGIVRIQDFSNGGAGSVLRYLWPAFISHAVLPLLPHSTTA